MPRKIKPRTFEEAIQWLCQRGCQVAASGGRTRLIKGIFAAELETAPNGTARVATQAGVLIEGDIARLIDKGFQKFWKTSKREIPAQADQLKAVHAFAEELRAATGATSLYNESLGSVSDRYVYDRVVERDTPEAQRHKRPWELKGA